MSGTKFFFLNSRILGFLGAFIIVAGATLFFAPQKALASFPTQLDHSFTCDIGGTCSTSNPSQTLGNGWSGTASHAVIWNANAFSDPYSIVFGFYECDINSFSDPSCFVSFQISTSSITTTSLVQIALTATTSGIVTPYTFDPAKYYFISGIGGTTGSDFGSDSGFNLYLDFVSGTPPFSSTSTSITLNTPVNNFAGSLPVAFDIDYYVNSIDNPDSYQICVEYINMTSFASMVPDCQFAMVSGGVSWSFSKSNLYDNSRYLWSVRLTRSDGSTIILSPTRSFTVGTPQEGQQTVVPFPDTDEQATTTVVTRLNNIFSLFVGIIDNKFPFNWGVGVANDFTSLLNVSTTTVEFPSAILDLNSLDLTIWQNPAISSTTINARFTLFSTTTIKTVSEMSWVPAMYAMFTAFMWFGFGWHVMQRVLGLFNNTTEK